ncbi:metal ABC transporter substrate-binding protein [Acidobacteria bacterium AH-259-O06]|nr:metal ABC transporter substrate-binding protein [Acidobacteria bacterium AH-259-O06]
MTRNIYKFLLALTLLPPLSAANDRLKIVSSLPDYASIAEYVGGDKVEVMSIAKGYQDAHFVKAKPSFAREMSRADLFLTTGMDLELWVPTLIDKSRNRKIREAEPGYVSVSRGMAFSQVPRNPNRAAGDIHVYGNPHIHTDPLKGIQVAENILIGLKKVDPRNSSYYDNNFQAFKSEIYRRLYGADLVKLVGGDQLARLTQNKQLDEFLDKNQFGGKSLRSYLGGWLKEVECLRNKQIIAYHKNWIYFTDRFGLQIADYVEYKPGIPPSARHVVELIEEIQTVGIKAIFTANYFDEKAPRMIEEKTGAKALIVPLSVGGTEEVRTYFDLFDIWIRTLKSVFSDCK